MNIKAQTLAISAVCGILYAALFEAALAALWFTGGYAVSFVAAAVAGILVAAIIRPRGNIAKTAFLSLAASLASTLVLGRLGVTERIFLAANPELERKTINELMTQGLMVLGFLAISLACFLCALVISGAKKEVRK